MVNKPRVDTGGESIDLAHYAAQCQRILRRKGSLKFAHRQVQIRKNSIKQLHRLTRTSSGTRYVLLKV